MRITNDPKPKTDEKRQKRLQQLQRADRPIDWGCAHCGRMLVSPEVVICEKCEEKYGPFGQYTKESK